MFRNVTPEKAIVFVESIVALSHCWPLPSTATKSRIFYYKLLRSVLLLNSLLLLFPLLYAIYVHREDPVKFCKAVSLALAVVQIPLHSSFCISQYDRYQRQLGSLQRICSSAPSLIVVSKFSDCSDVFQRLIEEMKSCCEKGNSHERRVFQQYVDKYAMYYVASAAWFYCTATTVLIGTLFIPDPFPTMAEYPFPVDSEPIRSIIFLQQSLVGFQCSSAMCINIFCALLMLFAAARFEILMNEMRTDNNVALFVKHVKKYYALKR
ncbi:hypothetical protein E2986_11515 [Frieseomelitta varia]|uniref:Odorant receptor n=1 Tax=Frieseomelitta varia TaxID=561572 RepID=A0A833RXE2_9HYME|nr:hypothetical protein E2986_11515 [Frieseomelitta varia]